MNKRDFVWIGVRILGLYLVIQAVLMVPHLALEVIGTAGSIIHGNFGGLMGFGAVVAVFLIQGGLGLYFVFSGGAVVDMLAKWPPTKTIGQ
jgi:hypothetical protein